MSTITFKPGYKYQLKQDYRVRIPICPPADIDTQFIRLDRTGLLCVRSGYVWNGPSGPTVDTADFTRGSLVHDALYQLMRERHLDQHHLREPADRLRREHRPLLSARARPLLLLACLSGGFVPVRAAKPSAIDAAVTALKNAVPQALTDTFAVLGANHADIQRKAQHYNAFFWKRVSEGDVGSAGGLACAVPMSGFATLPVDLAYLFRELYGSVIGLGYVMGLTPTKDDFANVLALWADDAVLSRQQIEQAAALAGSTVRFVATEFGEDIFDFTTDRAGQYFMEVDRRTRNGMLPRSLQVGASTHHPAVAASVAYKSGAKVGAKIGAKTSVKVGTKIAAKYGAKVAAAPVPVISAGVCSAVNVYIMYSMLRSAESYFQGLKDYYARAQAQPRIRK